MILLGLLVYGWVCAFSDYIGYIPYYKRDNDIKCGHC